MYTLPFQAMRLCASQKGEHWQRTQIRLPTHLSTSSLGSRCDGLPPVNLVGNAAIRFTCEGAATCHVEV